MKYHIKRDKEGNPAGPGSCSAKTEDSCPNKGFHSGDKAQVQAHFEQELAKTHNPMVSMTKRTKKSGSVKAHKKAMPTGVLSPAKVDENGNEVRPAGSYEDYYAGTNKKHFMDKKTFMSSDEAKEEFLNQPGSQFDPMKADSLEKLVDITAASRKDGLDGDDREELIKRGANPKAFNENFRYLITPVGGHLGSITSDGLSDYTRVGFYEKTSGSNIVSMTIEQDDKPKVDYGVLIMGSRSKISPGNPGETDDESVVVTAHPGLPSVPNPARNKMSREEKADYDAAEHKKLKRLAYEGKLTVREIRKMKGDREFNLNVKLPTKEERELVKEKRAKRVLSTKMNIFSLENDIESDTKKLELLQDKEFTNGEQGKINYMVSLLEKRITLMKESLEYNKKELAEIDQ